MNANKGAGRYRYYQHADVRRMVATMRCLTEAMRALVLEASFNLDKSLYGKTEIEREDSRLLAEFLLPVCKAGVGSC